MALSPAVQRDSSGAPSSGTLKDRLVRKGVAVVGAAGVALAIVVTAPPAVAKAPPHDPKTVASGLNSPRHLSFAPNGDLYIAESGEPGAAGSDCNDHPEFGLTCLTHTSSISRLSKHGKLSRVVQGLPSLASEQDAVGAFDVLLHGNTLTVAMGLAGPPELRDLYSGVDADLLGTVIEIKQAGKKKQRVTTLADLAAYEGTQNPAAGPVDSNPVDLAWSGRSLIVTDAGANTVYKVSKKGSIDELAVFADPVLVDPPPFPPDFPGDWPDPFPAEPVPTAAAKGPDGAWYVSQLTGFPFQPGAATIWRVSRNGNVTPYATGLTNVTDLAWHGRTLYAVQIADEGLLGAPSGSLLRVSTSGVHKTVADNLFAPYGLAIKGGHAYVTTGSVAAGIGEVVKIRLR